MFIVVMNIVLQLSGFVCVCVCRSRPYCSGCGLIIDALPLILSAAVTQTSSIDGVGVMMLIMVQEKS